MAPSKIANRTGSPVEIPSEGSFQGTGLFGNIGGEKHHSTYDKGWIGASWLTRHLLTPYGREFSRYHHANYEAR